MENQTPPNTPPADQPEIQVNVTADRAEMHEATGAEIANLAASASVLLGQSVTDDQFIKTITDAASQQRRHYVVKRDDYLRLVELAQRGAAAGSVGTAPTADLIAKPAVVADPAAATSANISVQAPAAAAQPVATAVAAQPPAVAQPVVAAQPAVATAPVAPVQPAPVAQPSPAAPAPAPIAQPAPPAVQPAPAPVAQPAPAAVQPAVAAPVPAAVVQPVAQPVPVAAQPAAEVAPAPVVAEPAAVVAPVAEPEPQPVDRRLAAADLLRQHGIEIDNATEQQIAWAESQLPEN